MLVLLLVLGNMPPPDTVFSTGPAGHLPCDSLPKSSVDGGCYVEPALVCRGGGVYGVFFAPSDLSAATGYRVHAGGRQVLRAIFEGMKTVGMGIFSPDHDPIQRYPDSGVLSAAVCIVSLCSSTEHVV